MPAWLVLVALGIIGAVVVLAAAGTALLWVGAVVLLAGVAGIARSSGTRA